MSNSFAPSIGGSISDLDGFSLSTDNCYPQMHPTMYYDNTGDFGFDPPTKPSVFSIKMETYSPPEDSPFDDFDFDPKHESSVSSPMRVGSEMDRMLVQNIPNSAASIARYGQVTPPRSNSESSTEKVDPKSPKQRRPTKSTIKDTTTKPATSGRKRKNARKASIVSIENPEEDEKRRQSLEKNRLAAAKCRVNKKEKTEQLQRDSHDKAVENAFLKEQVMRMKEEVQQMNALLLAHANSEGCKSPDNIQKHLSNLGNEFLAHHMPGAGHDFSSFNMSMDMDMKHEHEHYFHSTEQSLHPPLPEFDREPDFDITTPMHTD